jgi:hypothetical protein
MQRCIAVFLDNNSDLDAAVVKAQAIAVRTPLSVLEFAC